MPEIGYGRVSTDGQSLEAQETELQAAGVDKIFKEKASGAETTARNLQGQLARSRKAMSWLSPDWIDWPGRQGIY
jgi:DNA invertase Pin-like site-specific DNA recombinase